MPIDLVERLDSVTCLNDSVPVTLEQIAHYAPQLILVIDQQDLGRQATPLPVGYLQDGSIGHRFEQLESPVQARSRCTGIRRAFRLGRPRLALR